MFQLIKVIFPLIYLMFNGLFFVFFRSVKMQKYFNVFNSAAMDQTLGYLADDYNILVDLLG